MIARDEVMDALREVCDPCCEDRGISIVDMGPIEDIRIDGSDVQVGIVLTTGWCPFVANMSTTIPERLRQLPGVEDVSVEVLWEPVWTPERLSEKARGALSTPLDALRPITEARVARERATLQEV
jgi:metal-sulfur cluster biosynthetic enzyme